VEPARAWKTDCVHCRGQSQRSDPSSLEGFGDGSFLKTHNTHHFLP
ncbi:hypothetical protein LEMLEM_LOCUS13773, partial [Lemmus lemmus]